MKRTFEIIGIFSLFVFSYVYTNKVASLFLENDDLMVSINDYKEQNDFSCSEGYITEEGIILGINGLIVDKNKSYSNMKGNHFNKDLIIYTKDKCLINKENNLDSYIISGNSIKKGVSLSIVVNKSNVNQILEFLNSKNVEISLIINDIFNHENNTLNKLKNYSLLYSGNNENELKKLVNSNKRVFCVSIENENIDICKKQKINTIKTSKIYNKNLYSSVKNNLESGDIIILDNEKELFSNFDSIINFINAKGLKIVNIFDLLE